MCNVRSVSIMSAQYNESLSIVAYSPIILLIINNIGPAINS